MMLIHYLVCFLFFLTIETNGSLLNIERGLNEYVSTKNVPHYLVTAFNAMKLKSKMSNNKLQCDVCKIVAQTAIDFRKNETDDEILYKYFVDMCTIMSSSTECKAELAIDTPSFLYILDNTKNLTAERICAVLLHSFNCQDPNYEPWSIDIPLEISSERPERNDTTSEELKVVHLTDIHYDPLYEAGRLSVGCESTPCCQNIHSKSNNSKTAAGYWGDYNACDTPWYAILDLFQQVVKQHSQIEMIYLTGDIISHQSWATSVEFNSECLRKVMNELKEQFKAIPIYPVLGNHDSYPANVFSPTHVTAENISTQWLLDFVAEEWSRWLPEETKSTIKKGGYYTVLAKTGFRIIGLNSNVCAFYNYWLIYNDQDPYDQLKWLVEVLLEAEKNNEAVHILSHIPANDADCWKQWSHQYRRIINRFSNTITAQFYGHTHSNEISVFYDFTNTDIVTNVAFTGGSFTGYSGGNPSYKIYNVESINYNVLDYEEWIYNLTEANQNPDTNPRWFKLYSFKDAYGLESLDSINLNKFIQNLSSNATILEQYRRFKVRDSPIGKSRCDKYCLKNIFCSTTVGEFDESIQCKAFKNYFGITST